MDTQAQMPEVKRSSGNCRSARFDLLPLALSELTIEQCITFILLT